MQNTELVNSGRMYIDYLRKKQKERIMPFSITFELTPLCNFRCKMCYVRLDKDQLSTSGKLLSSDEWIEIAKQAKDVGVFKIVFTGGEVFTHPDFQKIYETIYDMGFHISIISNGYLVNEKALEWLRKRKPDFIKITLYGANDETYRNVCGIDNGFTIVTSNIQEIKRNGISVVTCMTVIEDNNEDIEQLKGWTAAENIKFIYSKVIRKKVGNARSSPESVRLPYDFESDIEADEIRHTADLYPEGNDSPFENCLGYHSSCIISWNGIVKGCNFINTITEDIREKKLIDCFKELWSKLDNIRRPKKCQNCKFIRFCNPCPGKLEGESGNPEETSEYVCDIAKWCFYNVNLEQTTSFSEVSDQCLIIDERCEL